MSGGIFSSLGVNFELDGANDDYAYSIVQTADGGFAVAGETWSFGASESNFLVLRLGPDGSYPGCVVDCSPTVGTPNPSTSSPSVGVDCTPSVNSPTPTVTTPTPSITDPCTPVDVGEISFGGQEPAIICSAFQGGVLFNSPVDLGIKIYSVDGRLAYSGHLQKGENRITLGQGVYLWQAGPYKGKAAVR